MNRWIAAVLALSVGSLWASPPAKPAASIGSGAHAAAAAQGGISAPLLGLVATGPTELRPITGIPGSALAGAPLPLPDGISRVYLSPAQNYALAASGEHNQLSVIAIAAISFGDAAALPDAIANPARIVFSPTGASAAVVGTGRLQIWAGLPASPRLVLNMDNPALLQGVRAVAVSDSGDRAIAQLTTGSIYLLTSNDAPHAVWSATGDASLAFLPATDTALVFDATTRQLIRLANLGGDMSSLALIDAADGTGEILTLSRDGSVAFLLGASSEAMRIDLAALSQQAIPLPTPATQWQAMPDAAQFIISAQAGNPVWVLDTAGTQPRTYFIPLAADPPDAAAPPEGDGQ